MTKKSEAPESRELTPGEVAANDAHEAAHAAAVKQEKELEQLIKDKRAAGEIDPSVRPDMASADPQHNTGARAADVFPVRAEQHGGAVGPEPEALPSRSKSESRAPESKKH